MTKKTCDKCHNNWVDYYESYSCNLHFARGYPPSWNPFNHYCSDWNNGKVMARLDTKKIKKEAGEVLKKLREADGNRSTND